MTEEPRTLNEIFNLAVTRYRDDEFVRFKRGDAWQSLSFGEVARRVREVALGLVRHGIRRGDRVAIWSENRPEWNIADLATLAVGAVDVPIYTTQSLDQVEYILSDSAARAIFVSAPFLDKVLELKPRLASLEHIFVFDEPAIEDEAITRAEALASAGRALFGEQPGLYESLWQAAQPEDLATLLYTSGTTGDPKGVMLTHKNLTANTLLSYRWSGLENRRDRVLTYLPFTHIFERSMWYLFLHAGALVVYAESIDRVAANLAEVGPTVMTSVPRMFEKIYARILERGLGAGFPKKQIFLWALDVGHRWAVRRDQGEPIGWWLSLQHRIADKLVFSKWREAVGGRIRVFISGGAPLAPEIAYLFAAAGLPILQGYGMTETSPSISCNTEARNRIGSVGPVLDGVRVKIAEDGEILVKGDTVMKGYYNRPEENAAVFTDDGWLRTGDIGYLDGDGFLVITDRKKELIKTSGGKYVAPQRVESMIKSSRFVSQVFVVGNARKFPAALIVPNLELLRSYAKLKAIEYDSDRALLEHPRILDLIERQVNKYTAELGQWEKVKRIALLEQELTIESGDLTPTLKARRSVIERHFANVIERLYAEDRNAVTAAARR
ncbi:MAG TPA: long-chain fatty acid--CoA ligase [Blastocatellia bacterium]|nr:long-chain fatty acid--CoA ligase [Blastocatellia bacterium]